MEFTSRTSRNPIVLQSWSSPSSTSLRSISSSSSSFSSFFQVRFARLLFRRVASSPLADPSLFFRFLQNARFKPSLSTPSIPRILPPLSSEGNGSLLTRPSSKLVNASVERSSASSSPVLSRRRSRLWIQWKLPSRRSLRVLRSRS